MFNTAVNFLRLRRGSTPDKPPAKRRTTSKQSTSSILHKVRRGRVDRGRFEVDKQTAKAITRMARQTALGFSRKYIFRAVFCIDVTGLTDQQLLESMQRP